MSKKGRQKGHEALASKKKDGKKALPLADFFAVLFCPPIKSAVKKDTKKSSRPFWTAKGRREEKDGKRSWHLHSALVKEMGKALVPVGPTLFWPFGPPYPYKPAILAN